MKTENTKVAIYPGTFDPITNGHIDIIKRAATLFDHVIIAVAKNPHKKPAFTVKERMDMIRHVTHEIKGTSVDSFEGLLVDYASINRAHAVIRGLRAVSDFEFELQMALVNRKLDENLITVFMMPHENYSYLNSSIVKELVSFDGDVDSFVPPYVKENLIRKIKPNERS